MRLSLTHTAPPGLSLTHRTPTSSAHDDDVPGELEAKSAFVWVDRAKTWVAQFLRQRGFYGILVMASVPNPLFDLCGICCGHYLMPFSSFFVATFLGKVGRRLLTCLEDAPLACFQAPQPRFVYLSMQVLFHASGNTFSVTHQAP